MASSSSASPSVVGKWTRPSHPLWPQFEAAVDRSVWEWDVAARLVDEHDDGEGEEELEILFDDLIFNFAERLEQGRGTTVESVTDFFVEGLLEHFNAEVEPSVVFPMAKVLVLIFDEIRAGNSTGVEYILSKPDAPSCMEEIEETDEAAPQASSSAGEGIEVEAPASSSAQPEVPTPAAVEDGWTTIPAKKKKSKNPLA